MNKTNQQRRSLIKSLAIGGGLLGMTPIVSAQTACLGKTPAQTKGPFYPIREQIDKDADLTVVEGSLMRAEGQTIDLIGRVTDVNCQPIADAFVEIWQACASGRYNHPADPNQAPLDPHFQYWGIVKTSSDGEYGFRTIIPGSYPASDQWMRPPHIHFKVHKWGFRELITQLYFEGETLNSKDLILNQISETERHKVVRPIINGIVEFDITLT